MSEASRASHPDDGTASRRGDEASPRLDAGASPRPDAVPARPRASVPSPCISVCRIDPASGLCEGCLRTLDEIARWGSMNDEARGAVWRSIELRRGERAARSDAAPRPDESHRGA